MNFLLISSILEIQIHFYFFDFVDEAFAIAVNAVKEYAIKLPLNFELAKVKH